MDTSDDIKSDLQQARDEVKRAFMDVVGNSKLTQDEIRQQLASAQSRRDSLRAKFHHDIDERMGSLESERDQLAQSVRGSEGEARAKAGQRLHDVEKKIAVTRSELVADAEVTLGEVDEEIKLLELRSREGEGDAGSNSAALTELRSRRTRLREKARTLREAAADRFREARSEYEEEVAYLTDRRNEGMIGSN
jgi:hypothetical protein